MQFIEYADSKSLICCLNEFCIITWRFNLYPVKSSILYLITCLQLIAFTPNSAFGQQNLSWWNDVHQWDGFTHWSQYMTYSTSYMGPNAIPIPEMKKGFLQNKLRFENGAEGHWSKGDNTYNLFQKLSCTNCQ